MPYIARTNALSELAFNGGLFDPRAGAQPSFGKRMVCRDVTNFIANTTKSLPSDPRHERAGDRRNKWRAPCQKSASEYQAKLDRILAHSRDIKLPLAGKNSDIPVSEFVPGLVVSGGLSRSPAFDSLPVVSHWADRTDESSAEDPDATVCLSSTWSTTHVMGEGATMRCPLGAPCWSLKTHGIGPVEVGSSKFSQQYLPETDTLVTTVNLARRHDTTQTNGVIDAAISVSWMRNARVADAVDCATGLLADAATLLAARDRLIKTGRRQRLPFAEVRAAELPVWCSARKPLPPKLSGIALSSDQAVLDILAVEDCDGPLLNTSIFSMALGYNRGVYGGSISGLWGIMDSGFVLDYSIGIESAEVAESLSSAFAEVAAIAEESVSAGPHISDIRIVKGCDYACLRQKTIIEDTHPISSRPCMVVWDDLARLARYKVADAVFCHVYYDAGGGEQMAAIAGLGCVVHDWVDLGADIACAEVSNIIPTLTRGSLEEEPLLEVYSRLLGSLIWYRDNDPYNPAALCILFTHWWQLANCRHRPVTLLGRTDLGVGAGVAATMPDGRPTLEHFQANGTTIERGERPLANAEARLQSVLSSDPLPETRAVIELLVDPVLAYIRGADSLPSENEYLAAVLAAELAYPQGQKIMELWDLAIVMWECGAMWAAGVAGLCYTHAGKANCDRARDDLADTTWS
ncbi:uncharacterized protein N7479_008701 [Penicillium vulpinum]|uniref:Uncharacterized protein n=1 Tax=Penicillium vulpinum TaxID=29845 RepID=A0A1V6S0Y7_9EURO|nr:uncharacterized protein N7479_008701 [Penicillium vulpinum]KAJ5950288.1 hypothetical protein N7479_008701 [Penicillium vulpinum]OQE07702.1 hypothetical protein PENVUL_c012G02974 [Penicillium vulpinum]